MTGKWTGKCLTCGVATEGDDRSTVQWAMDGHATQEGHKVTVFQGRRYSRMMDGFVEGDYRGY